MATVAKEVRGDTGGTDETREISAAVAAIAIKRKRPIMAPRTSIPMDESFVASLTALKDEYSKEEVEKMTDEMIVKHFIRITGLDRLSCTHCKGYRPIMPYWIVSVAKRCKKVGISKDIKLPKSCDNQAIQNDKWNMKNNALSRVLRSDKISNEEKKAYLKKRMEEDEAMGLKYKRWKNKLEMFD